MTKPEEQIIRSCRQRQTMVAAFLKILLKASEERTFEYFVQLLRQLNKKDIADKLYCRDTISVHQDAETARQNILLHLDEVLENTDTYITEQTLRKRDDSIIPEKKNVDTMQKKLSENTVFECTYRAGIRAGYDPAARNKDFVPVVSHDYIYDERYRRGRRVWQMEEFFGHPDMYYRRFEMMRRPMRRHLGVASKPATNEPEEKKKFVTKHKTVAAIDFGTSYSGYAFSSQENPLEVRCDENLVVFDHMGRPMDAEKVISTAIGYLFVECKDAIAEKKFDKDDILWVMTVPSLWNNFAKQFLRKAAEKAGIPRKQLILTLEPEVAAIYTIKGSKPDLPSDSGDQYVSGTQILLVDLGGGTADFTLMGVAKDGGLEVLHEAVGGAWGGTTINARIWEFMEELLTKDVIDEFKKQTSDYLDMESNIELKKRDLSANNKLLLLVYPSLASICKDKTGKTYKTLVEESEHAEDVKVRTGKIIFEPKMIEKIFERTLKECFSVMDEILQDEGCDYIGKLTINIEEPPFGVEPLVRLFFKFGEIETTVEGKEVLTDKPVKTDIDFLERKP
uniref:Heat shock 70 kDa protein 12A n=1 Tax=Magallana gigas TaxID=29159 RepID=K1RZR1_MAGGI